MAGLHAVGVSSNNDCSRWNGTLACRTHLKGLFLQALVYLHCDDLNGFCSDFCIHVRLLDSRVRERLGIDDNFAAVHGCGLLLFACYYNNGG